ncbi:hypothetical protein CCP3SC1_520002 [Gammaproteobacteria bacterium]
MGLLVLISAFKAIRTKNGQIILTNPSTEGQSLTELVRLNEIFEIYTDTGAALEALQGR